MANFDSFDPSWWVGRASEAGAGNAEWGRETVDTSTSKQ